MMRKRTLSYLLKVLVGGIILLLLARSMDLSLVLQLFAHLNLYWLALALMIVLSLRMLMAVRWQYILAAHAFPVPLLELTRITFISTSLGQVLPGGLGADVAKGYQLFRKYGRLGNVTVTLLLDRLIGLYSMFFVAFVGSLIAKHLGLSTNLVVPLLVAQAVFIFGWFGIYLVRKKISTLAFLRRSRYERLAHKFMGLLSDLTDLATIKSVFVRIFAISILMQVLRAIIFYCIYQAFGHSADMIYYLVFIPIVFVVVMLPVSVGGLGVREGALVFFFKTLGIPNEVSISVGVMFLVVQIVAAVPGIVLWIVDKQPKTGLVPVEANEPTC
ncbi:MAG: UPF0104 family protein [Calditrichaeota bacterium]|nr:MAG: UPF0104 family protein [Calditrichota bacterium]